MAERTPVITRPADDQVVVVWSGLLNTDTGAPVAFPGYTDRTVQVKGTLGAGGTATIQGSNDAGTTYHALNDPNGNSLAINALKIEQVLEVPSLTRPSITAGDGTTNLTVTMTLSRPRR